MSSTETLVRPGQIWSDNVGRAALAESVKRVAQIYSGLPKAGSGMRFDFQRDHIGVDVLTADGERALERFEWTPADAKFKGVQMGFHWNYIADALAAFPGERVNLHLPVNGEGALYLTDGDDGAHQIVVMPMRI